MSMNCFALCKIFVLIKESVASVHESSLPLFGNDLTLTNDGMSVRWKG